MTASSFRTAATVAVLLASAVAATALARPVQDRAASAGWQALVDGADLTQWRGFKDTARPTAWTATGGTLTLSDTGTRGDLVTAASYRDFELELEWRITAGGNSGILYFVREPAAAQTTYATGLEMQVLDDARHADGKLPSHRAGALYDLIPASIAAAVPVGGWNKVRIVVRGPRIEHWLNGRRVVATTHGDARWNAMVAESKFKAMPDFARVRSGHIALQDHGDAVRYRNIRIRRL